jgi:hypothetical protein
VGPRKVVLVHSTEHTCTNEAVQLIITIYVTVRNNNCNSRQAGRRAAHRQSAPAAAAAHINPAGQNPAAVRCGTHPPRSLAGVDRQQLGNCCAKHQTIPDLQGNTRIVPVCPHNTAGERGGVLRSTTTRHDAPVFAQPGSWKDNRLSPTRLDAYCQAHTSSSTPATEQGPTAAEPAMHKTLWIHRKRDTKVWLFGAATLAGAIQPVRSQPFTQKVAPEKKNGKSVQNCKCCVPPVYNNPANQSINPACKWDSTFRM